MANKNYNKQVTPKGYKMGGRVKKMGGGMMKRPMYSNGKLVGGQKKLDVAPPKGVLNKADFKALGDAGSRAKKMGGGMMKRPMYKDGTKPKKDPKKETVKKGMRQGLKDAVKKLSSIGKKANLDKLSKDAKQKLLPKFPKGDLPIPKNKKNNV